YRLAQGRESRLTLPLLLGALGGYTIALDAVDVRFGPLFSGRRRVPSSVTALADPALCTSPPEASIAVGPSQLPCIDPLPAPDRDPTSDPQLIISVPCADVGDTITVVGRGFFPDAEGELRWLNPIGDIQRVPREGQQVVFTPDATGTFTETVRVPQ